MAWWNCIYIAVSGHRNKHYSTGDEDRGWKKWTSFFSKWQKFYVRICNAESTVIRFLTDMKMRRYMSSYYVVRLLRSPICRLQLFELSIDEFSRTAA